MKVPTRHLHSVGAVLLALFLAARGAAAQTPTIRLGQATATFADEFTHIGSVRELADGSVLVTDPAEIVLKHLDPGTGHGERISRTGQGPLEYSGLWGGLHALRGDSTLLDNSGGRWLFLAGARMLGVSGLPADQQFAAGSMLGADTVGRILTSRSIDARPADGGSTLTMMPLSDSAVILFGSLRLERSDTVARVRKGAGPLALGVGTQALLFPDGWIAIAYPDPYHVEWRAPDGRRVRGASLPDTRAPVDARQKDFTISRAETRLAALWRAMNIWPEVLPAFVRSPDGLVNQSTGSLQAAPDGRLVILRTPDANTPTTVRYDVIDRTGALSATISLPIAERIVAFGPKSVYVSVRNADDIQRLRRHAWPPAP